MRDLFWRMLGKGALRRDNWKYVFTTANDALNHQLYDLAIDPSERANLAVRNGATLAELRGAREAIAAGLLPYS